MFSLKKMSWTWNVPVRTWLFFCCKFWEFDHGVFSNDSGTYTNSVLMSNYLSHESLREKCQTVAKKLNICQKIIREHGKLEHIQSPCDKSLTDGWYSWPHGHVLETITGGFDKACERATTKKQMSGFIYVVEAAI